MMDGTFYDELVHEWLAAVAENAWVSLHYESPSLGGLGLGEIHGGGYLRKQVTFSTPSARTIWSLTNVKFTGLPANRLTHFGIWNAANKGRIQASGPLPTEVIIASGGGYLLAEGKLALSIQ